MVRSLLVGSRSAPRSIQCRSSLFKVNERIVQLFTCDCSKVFIRKPAWHCSCVGFSFFIREIRGCCGYWHACRYRCSQSNGRQEKGQAMSLKLEHVTRIVDGQVHIDDACLSFEPGSFNVLLGRTLAGKTSLMRLMAGLDRPSSGRVLMNGADVTGVPVRQRNVSMVYQQFINYPTLTVFENIALPLRQAGMAWERIVEKVEATARMLRIDKLLSRYPLELSGGQQQRTAMARALVKDASLILFDEPLVNLDYKLREELRQEMREL